MKTLIDGFSYAYYYPALRPLDGIFTSTNPPKKRARLYGESADCLRND
jgi:hypothetical protein